MDIEDVYNTIKKHKNIITIRNLSTSEING